MIAGRAPRSRSSGALLVGVISVLLLGAAPAEAALRRVAVDAGARTRALVDYLQAEGGVTVTSAAEAELRVVLREAGATWTLDIRDRHDVRVLRRDFGAAGGEQAALRVAAVLIERALAAVPALPLVPAPPPPPAVVASTTRGATVADPRAVGTVRALPATPLMPTAASLIASASALPAGSSTSAAVRARPPAVDLDAPDGPRLGRLRPATTATRATEGLGLARAATPVDAAAAPPDDAPREAPAAVASPGEATASASLDPRGTTTSVGPAAPADAPREPSAPEPSPGREAVAGVVDGPPALVERRPEARPDTAPVIDPAQPGRWRLVASAAARWWRSPGDVPQIGFGLGAERRVGPLVLGGAARLAGVPCCARDTSEVRANVQELGLAGYGLWPLLTSEGGGATLHAAADLEGALVRGEGQRIVTGTSPATVADLLGASVALGVGPALELAVTPALGFRLRVLVRVSLVSYEAGLGPGLDPIHTGVIHPYIDLALPLGI